MSTLNLNENNRNELNNNSNNNKIIKLASHENITKSCLDEINYDKSFYNNNLKLTLAECRKAVSNGVINYSDDELIKMRDWFDELANNLLKIVERTRANSLNEIINRRTKNSIETNLQNE